MAGTRSALIVANDRYQDSGLRKLRAPTRDAEALARVLGEPGIGNFDVKVVTNEPEHRLRREIAAFFAERARDDLLLAHLSCHGIKDDSGQLYFATADTELGNLDATAVPADFVNRHMTRSRSRRIVLLLDCCYSGAFARGMLHRADTAIDLKDRFEGHGRIVLTASSAMEYAFEDADLHGQGRPSLFTRTLVQGLETGDADRDGDGLISVEELYDYIFDHVRKATPNQTPGRWNFETQGDLLIARNPHVRLTALLPELQQALEHPVAGVRLGAVSELGRLLHGSHPGMALAARQALERLRRDDSQRVSKEAALLLAAQGPPERDPRRERPPPRQPTPPPTPPPSRRPTPPPTPTPRPRPVRPSARLLLLVLLPLLLAGGVLGFTTLRSPRGTSVAVGERFAATSPWRVQVHGDNCGVSVASASGEQVNHGFGSYYELQMRSGGDFSVSSLTAGCRATVIGGAGGTAGLPLAMRQGAHGTGGDSPVFHSAAGFQVTVTGTSCRTGIYRSSSGMEVEQFDGSESVEVDQAGDFYVHSDARCSTTIAPS